LKGRKSVVRAHKVRQQVRWAKIRSCVQCLKMWPYGVFWRWRQISNCVKIFLKQERLTQWRGWRNQSRNH